MSASALSIRTLPLCLLLLSCGTKSPEPLPTDSTFSGSDDTDTVDTDDPSDDSGIDSGTDSGTDSGIDSGTGDDTAVDTATDTGDSGEDTGTPPDPPMPDFVLDDLNPSSPTFGTPVSPRDLLAETSGWYFTHST
jgi:hypothetical protein